MIASKARNFRDIFCSEDELKMNGITIPIVQRDYAQGRKTASINRIRSRFLNVLYEALVDNKHVTLDFVYGSVEHEKLIPLDGQQRLTTLFLLHCYVAKHENVSEEEYSFLKKFSYETRISSREFCSHLYDFKPDFNAENLSQQIYDEAWFMMEWESDPTVQAMLVMLDDIHTKFKGTEGIWSKLTGDAITFYFLPIDDLGVTDELYIKMNSRGKPLSQFEHFKAELELRMKEVNADVAKRISFKIDREWTDLLWPYRNSGINLEEVDQITDDEFLRYIHFISDIISFKNGNVEIEDEFDIIDKQFSKSCPKALDNMRLLETCFDVWVWESYQAENKTKRNVKDFFEKFISKGQYEEGKILLEERDVTDTIPNLFSECCKCYGRKIGLRPMFPLGRTILLYSCIVYLQYQKEISECDFKRRFRIINNLVRNSSNTLRSEYMNVLLSQVEEIIRYGKLEQITEGKARFQSRQFEEEIAKLEWEKEHPDLAEMLYKLEDHKYLNGFISTIGLEHVGWCERFYSLFECNLENINKALLAIGDYFEEDGWRYQIGNSNSATRMNVWRSLFSPLRNSERLGGVMIDLLGMHENFTDELLTDIYQNYLMRSKEMPVRYYLIRYKSMMPNKYGKYYWRNPEIDGRDSYKVIMMTTEWKFGTNYDIFLKTLYDIMGGKEVGLRIGDYSFSEYNNGQTDKLYLDNQNLYLTLDDNEYKICSDTGELIDSYKIMQNEQGIDIEDRVLAGLRLLNKYLCVYDENAIRSYISRCEWTYAKTMPQCPHEYIVKNKCQLSDKEFEFFVWTQRTLGKSEKWGPYIHQYLYIDGYKYWTMGCELENTIIINRAKA